MERTIIIECKACGGTGLRIQKEFHGAAVVCRDCKGTGKAEFTYTEFEGRKEMKGVNRIFPICASEHDVYFTADEDYVTADGRIFHFSQYGCSYEEWKNGIKPAPMEEMYCPLEYCLEDTSDTENAPCSLCESGKSLSGCLWYGSKARCWKEYHENND